MLHILRENKGFIRQIIKLAYTELIKTFKGAALGPVWVLLRPSITIFVYWFAFELGLRAGRQVEGHTFFVFLLVGIVPWFFMREAILDGSSCIRKRSNMVTKMPFPMSTIMTYVTLSKLFAHLGLSAIMYVLLIIMGYTPSIYNLQYLFYMPMMYIFFTCLAWTTAPLSCISRDFENVVKSVITAVFWLSGIIWNPHNLSDGLLKKLVLLNPVNYFANGYRNTFIYNIWFFETPYETVSFFVLLAIVMVIGSVIYNRLRKRILDVI